MTIESIVASPHLKVRQKAEEVAQYFSAQPDLGATAVVEILMSTSDARLASFASNYFALLPAMLDQKHRVFERLFKMGGQMTVAATGLLQFLPERSIGTIIEEYLVDPSMTSPLYNLAYESALYFPQVLRMFAAQIDNPRLRQGMLSGGPDPWVDDFRAQYEIHHSVDTIQSIGRFHTRRAAHSLLEIASEIAPDQRDTWLSAVENAGSTPDGLSSTVYSHSFRGFACTASQTTHRLGGRVPGVVPVCPSCSVAADHVLTLNSADLPYDLDRGRNPSFYWFGCSCSALSSIHIRVLKDGIQVLTGPMSEQGSEMHLIPREMSLLLEDHPNQTGRSLDSTGGFGRHQVGGFPSWISVEAHPFCPLCVKPMRFLCSIDSGMTIFGRLQFNGILYGFWCSDCATSTTLRQGV